MNQSYETWAPYPNVACVLGKKVLLSLNIPCCIVSCIFNGAIFVVLTSKVSFTDRSILSLTIADMLTSFISQPLLITVYLLDLFDKSSYSEVSLRLQRMAFFFNCVTCSASVISIAFVVIIRYIQIKNPLRYEEIATKKRLIATCIFTWICALVSSISAWITGIKMYIYYLYMLCGLGGMLLIISYINMSIIFITRRLVRDVRQSSSSSNKAMKTVIIIFAIFTISVFPFGVAGLTYFLKWPSVAWTYRSDYDCNDTLRNIHTTIYFFSILLYHVNAACNPLVYTLRDTRIKSALMRLLRRNATVIVLFMDGRNSNHDLRTRSNSAMTSNPSPNIHRSSTAITLIEAQKPTSNHLQP